MKREKYKCKKCENNEFITTPNRYDVFIAEDGKLLLQNSHYVDDEIVLFCRECSEELVYNDEDLII